MPALELLKSEHAIHLCSIVALTTGLSSLGGARMIQGAAALGGGQPLGERHAVGGLLAPPRHAQPHRPRAGEARRGGAGMSEEMTRHSDDGRLA
jgi:hypothetical protein